MMTSVAAKSSRRSLTFGLGLIFIIIWNVAWYSHLDTQRKQALDLLEDCPRVEQKPKAEGFWGKTKELFQDAGVALNLTGCKAELDRKKAAADAIVSGGMLGVACSSPFLFILSSYFSGWIVRRKIASQVAAQRQAEFIAQREVQRAAEQRERALVAANQNAKQKISRTEFIKKLGLAEMYLMLLSDPKNEDPPALLVENITSELRDIVAKHTLPELAALIQSDEAIQFKVKVFNQLLKKHSVQSSDADLLMFAATAQRPTGNLRVT